MQNWRVVSGARASSARAVLALTLALLMLAAITQPVALAAETEEGARFKNLVKVRTSGGVVVSESSQASQAGLEILKGGGNAVDAAIATTFAIGVTRPDNCGIGGGGHLLYRRADGTTKALDFRERAPALMTQNTFNQASEEGGTEKVKQGIHNEGSGHTVVGVPGVVAGMDAALKTLGSGKFELAELIAPAEQLARDGIKVTSGLQLSLFLNEAFGQRLENYPETARIYSGRWAVHGPILYRQAGLEDPTVFKFKQDDYAKSLRQIMKYGRDAFYTVTEYEDLILGAVVKEPSIGKLIVDDMKQARDSAMTNPVLMAKTGGTPNDIGLMTEGDLTLYQPKWKTPLVGHYRDHQVIAMPPPAGGMVAIEILNLLEHFKLSSFGHSSTDHIHALAEAQKLAWADRLKYLADPDPDFGELVPTEVLTSKRYAQQRVSEIDMEKAKSVDDYGHGTLTPPHEGANTTHISVIDRDGNAVAVTCSLNYQFGSGVVAPGTGFLLNNQLGDFDWTWKNGEPAPPANAPEGGKRPRSSQSPTIVVKDGRPILVTGGAGAGTIILGVVQNIVNVVDFGLDLFHAIDAPRMDAANAPFLENASASDNNVCTRDHLALEQNDNRIADSVKDQLIDREHRLCLVDSSDGYWTLPIVQSAATDFRTGERLAVSDPRAFFVDPLLTGSLMYDDQGPMGE